ncbi:MAG TPA: TorF family putative porin [Alphaproteobacteria bacterium]
MLALAPRAEAQAPPAPAAKPYEYTPWYEQKIIPAPLSATIAFWSNYRFRGISQTSNAPGYNGSLDFEQEVLPWATFYAGIWASNINFNGGLKPRVEVDVYGGFKGKVFEKLSWNVQLIGYLYPGSTASQALNYFEVMPSLSWDFGFMEVGGGVAISPNYTVGSGFATWTFGDVTVPIPIEILQPYKVAAFGHVGYQAIEKNAKFGTPDYLEWEVGVKWELYGFKMAVKYGDTNLKRSECFGGLDWCRATAVFVVSKTF